MKQKMRAKKGNEYIINDEFAQIIVHSRRHGTVIILIDVSDVNKCKKYTWGVFYAPNNNSLYAATYTRHPKKTIRLAGVIIPCPPRKIVDHINHNTLDNRKSNLRVCTYAENNSNKKGACKNNALGVRNVRYSSQLKKFIVRVKQQHIGCYPSLDEAKIAAESARNIMLHSS